MDVLAEFSWGQWFIVMTVIGVCMVLMLVILVQRGRGEGLSGAFGGGGSSAFGAKTGDVFTWITVVGAVIFLSVAVAANFVLDESSAETNPAQVDTDPGQTQGQPDAPPPPDFGQPTGSSDTVPPVGQVPPEDEPEADATKESPAP